jgi:hypothetical protein
LKPTFRASELARVLHCHGSTRLVPLVAKPEDGEASIEGTWCHWTAHAKIKSEYGAQGEIGPEPVAPKNTAFSAWIPSFYVSVLAEWIPSDWSWEVEAALEWETDRFIVTGHPDDLAISPDLTEARGADLKAGYIAVDAAEFNVQFLGYIVATKIAYPSLRKITWRGVQPRNDEDSGLQRVTEVTLEGEQLDRAVAYLEYEINKAIDNDLELNTGLTACKYCPAQLQCPALIAERELMKLTITKESIAAIEQTPNDGVLGDWALAAKLLTAPLKEAGDLAKDRIEQVGYIDAASGPRLTLKITNGDIEIPDKTAFREAVERALPERDRQDRCISWAKGALIKEIAAARGIPQESKKDASAADIWSSILAPLTTQGKRRSIVIT